VARSCTPRFLRAARRGNPISWNTHRIAGFVLPHILHLGRRSQPGVRARRLASHRVSTFTGATASSSPGLARNSGLSARRTGPSWPAWPSSSPPNSFPIGASTSASPPPSAAGRPPPTCIVIGAAARRAAAAVLTYRGARSPARTGAISSTLGPSTVARPGHLPRETGDTPLVQ